MNLITGDTNTHMTIHVFEEIFKRILFPMFSDEDFQKFMSMKEEAFDSWKGKFEYDHKMVQKLDLEDRVDQYSFENRSVLKEMYRTYAFSHMTDGVMDFDQFVKFLKAHKVNEDETLFDKIGVIYEKYLVIKLERAQCGKSFQFFGCFRSVSDEKSRLKKLLDPTFGSAKKSLSIMDIVNSLKAINSQFKRQANLFSKMLVCYSIYCASMLVDNQRNVQYKMAFFLAVLSILSNQLITYSSVINLKYTMNQYSDPEVKGVTMVMNYFMLTCFGILTTVIPM